MDQETDFLGSVFKIALGIFLGGLLLWAAFEWRVRYELREAQQALEASSASMRADRERATHAAGARDAEKAADQFFAEQRQAEAARQVAAHRAAEVAKERAWQTFFRPAPECITGTSVECGNAHIRARREFERQYSQSQSNILTRRAD
jgi:hypothetical protein